MAHQKRDEQRRAVRAAAAPVCRRCSAPLLVKRLGPLPTLCARCRRAIQGEYWAAATRRTQQVCSRCAKPCSGSVCRQCRRENPAPYKLQPIPCRSCGRLFQPSSSKRSACSAACWATYVRLDSEAKTAHQRLSRRRSSRVRASLGKTGWSVVGRWRTICERDGYVCWICGEAIDSSLRVPDKRAPTADHVVPLRCGGSDDDSSLRPAHFSCNSRRGAGRINPRKTA